MARDRRGGYQPPTKPAAVSGPGRLARRTDSPATQPVRLATGQPYGARTAMQAQQQAAPMAAAVRPGMAGPPTGGGAQPAGSPLPSVFRPTDRPNEPITAGIPFGPGASGVPASDDISDPDVLLAAMARVLPHPEIFRLMTSGHLPQGGAGRG